MPSFKLRLAQQAAAGVTTHHSTLLLGRVGSGKTAVAITALKRRSLVEKKRVLIIGTLRICNMVWGDELRNLAPEFSFQSAAGISPTQRSDILEDLDLDIVAINFDVLGWAVRKYGSDLPKMFPWLIIDESSKLENPAGAWSGFLRSLLPQFEWRLPMTGTPRANHLHDLWGNVYLADLGMSLGRFKEAFYQRWFTPIQRTHGVEWIPNIGAAEDIYSRIKHVAHVMPFESKEIKEISVRIPLADKVREYLSTIETAMQDGWATDLQIDNITFVRNGHKVSSKMLQLSSGQIYDDDGNVIDIHRDKFDALTEIIDEAKGEPVMVVYQFEHERDLILSHFSQAKVLDTEDVKDEWNAGQLPIMLVHPLSCGHGLNLQFGGHLQVWYSPAFDAEMDTQVIGRLNRPGNDDTVQVMRLIMEGTDDRRAYATVTQRQEEELDGLAALSGETCVVLADGS